MNDYQCTVCLREFSYPFRQPADCPDRVTGCCHIVRKSDLFVEPPQPEDGADDLDLPGNHSSSAVLTINNRQFPLRPGDILGRDGQTAQGTPHPANEEFQQDLTVSRRHLEILFQPKLVHVKNLAANGNPVTVNGRTLKFNESADLVAGTNSVKLGLNFPAVILVNG